MSKRLYYLLIFMILCISTFLECYPWEDEFENDPTVIDTPPDQIPYYDTDGDGISNAVETNYANAHHGFDTTVVDVDPSIAHGTPTNGWLEGGINLPDNGRGYYHHYGIDPVDRDDWGTLTLINMVEGGGRNWMDLYFNPRIGILDMSLQNGGPFTNYYNPSDTDHVSHQNGLDIDIRYVRNDNQEIGLDLRGADTIYYDQERTVEMLNCLIDAEGIMTLIIVHPNSEIPERTDPLPEIQHSQDHYDHIHVRIEDPDGPYN